MEEFKPISTKTLKEEFICRIEKLILSGVLDVNQKLPSERDLSRQMQISRPVVHEGLVDLTSKGLVTIRPRHGAVVNDYRKEGSLELLLSLFKYNKGMLAPGILRGILEIRLLFETEAAGMAAVNHTKEDINVFNSLLKEEEGLNPRQIEVITDVDFSFHHQIALSSGNIVYPLLMNSFRPLYKNMLSHFYQDKSTSVSVFKYHRELVSRICRRDKNGSADLMKELLEYSEKRFNLIISGGIVV